MTLNYAPKIPIDRSGSPMQEYPPSTPALVVTAAAPPAASSVVTFGSNTTAIEVTALNASLAIKWGSGSVVATGATANYDHIIPVNTTRRFVIPINTQGVPSIVGANAGNGLYSTMAVIATASVFSGISEY